MNKATFMSRFQTIEKPSELIKLFQDFTRENGGITDSDGTTIDLDTTLIEFGLTDGDEINFPIRIRVTLETTYFHKGGQTLTIPTAHFCTFFNIMEELHDEWHLQIASFLSQASKSFLNDNERVLAETFLKGLFSQQ